MSYVLINISTRIFQALRSRLNKCIAHYKGTPLGFTIKTSISISMAELLIMIFLSSLPQLTDWQKAFVDPILILTCVVPILYLWLYRPMIQDITNCKKAQYALSQSEEKFRTYVSNAPDAIFITDSHGRYIIDVNEEACKLTGYSESELTSMVMQNIVASDNQFLSFLKNLKTAGRVNTEIKLKRKDGSSIWSSLHAVTLSDDRVMAFCSDITETKRLQELEYRAGRLETAGTIAGQVAHDFNNLLAPILAYPEFIMDELPEDHPNRNYLVQIENAAQKIADINQQLLTLGRRGHYNQEVLNLNSIIYQAIMALPQLSDNVTLKTNLEPELLSILGGRSQIYRAVTNLLYNAIDALGEVGQIKIKTENFYVDDESGAYGRIPKGEYVKLTVTDTGCGISKDIAQKILDPFFTTKTTDKKRGSGLGLSVVDAVVKDHNGCLDLTTQTGKGTSFYLYFPTTRKVSDQDQVGDITGGTETILVIDDDYIQRDVSTQLLKRLGYEVSSVDSGEKAIEFLRENQQDLIMLDMIMPGGIDGTETYKQILEFNPNQKAIIVSGFSDSERVQMALDLGVGAFVKKPLTKRIIAAAVRAELNKEVDVLV